MAADSSTRMPMAFKVLIVAIPLLTLTVLGLSMRVPAAHDGMQAILGQTAQCSFSQSIHAIGTLIDRQRRTDEIRASATRLRSDGAYSLWRTRDGDYWIPERNASVLPFNLAEQEQDVYGSGVNGVQSG